MRAPIYKELKMYKQEKRYYKRAFFYAFFIAVMLLLPFVVIDGGYFIFYGDFNAQQIPFYKTGISAVHEGNLGWNWQTDLGANFVGSYSFYTLGSPFFWFASLFPASISHYLMAPLLALKLALSSFFAFIYLRRFVKKPESALVGGLLYAFSGFSLYNIFFNHFHEAIVFFPLLLIGLEEAVVNKRRGALAVAVALNAFVNYFFFIGECIFLVIYFVARLCMDKRFRINVADFFCLAFECIVGVLIAGILFIPSIFQVLDVPRSTNILTDSSFLFYGREQRYGLLLEAMFFPPEIAARTNMFSDANAKWSSVALYLPMFSMAGVAAFVKGAKKHWAKAVLIVCLVMAFVPGLNAAFTLFNNNFYTRWFYMPELLCCLATVYALENEKECDIKFGLKLSAVVVGVMSLLVAFHPITVDVLDADGNKTGETYTSVFATDMPPALLVQIGLAVVFLVLLGVLIRLRRKNPAAFYPQTLIVMTVVSSLLLGYYFIGYGRILGPYVGDYNKSVSADIHIDDTEFYRMEAISEINNVNMLWDMSSLKSFTSIIPNSTFEFYDLLNITRDVNSTPENEHYALRALTRVKYLMVRSDYNEEDLAKELEELKIFEYYSTQGDYDIYINQYAFPMGFAYDNYVDIDNIGSSSSTVDFLLCRAVALDDEQIKKHSDILTKLPDSDIWLSDIDTFRSDAQARIDTGVSSFRITGDGFAALSQYEDEELVVFSVPYDTGWSVTLNGAPGEVEKVNGGLLAVRVPAGGCNIEFTYTTPGSRLGVVCTIAGILLFAVYIVIIYVFRRHRPARYIHLYDIEYTEGIKAHYAYINQLSRQIYECQETGDPKRPGEYKLEWSDIEDKIRETEEDE